MLLTKGEEKLPSIFVIRSMFVFNHTINCQHAFKNRTSSAIGTLVHSKSSNALVKLRKKQTFLPLDVFNLLFMFQFFGSVQAPEQHFTPLVLLNQSSSLVLMPHFTSSACCTRAVQNWSNDFSGCLAFSIHIPLGKISRLSFSNFPS